MHNGNARGYEMVNIYFIIKKFKHYKHLVISAQVRKNNNNNNNVANFWGETFLREGSYETLLRGNSPCVFTLLINFFSISFLKKIFFKYI